MPPPGAMMRHAALVAAGYAAACLAVSLYGHAAALATMGFAEFGSFMTAEAPFFISVPLLVMLAGLVGFPPGAAAIALAEFRGIRSWYYFAAAGLAAGLFAVLAGMGIGATAGAMAALLQGRRLPPGFDPLIALLLLTAGVLGGLVYWAVAGRRSGGWRVSAPAPSGS